MEFMKDLENFQIPKERFLRIMPELCNILEMVLKNQVTNSPFARNILNCYHNYLELNVFTQKELLNVDFIKLVMNLLTIPHLDRELHILVINCIIELINKISLNDDTNDIENSFEDNPINYKWFIYHEVRLLEPAVQIEPKNQERLQNFCCLFSYLCEKMLLMLFGITDTKALHNTSPDSMQNVVDTFEYEKWDVIECLNLVLNLINGQHFFVIDPCLHLWSTIGKLLHYASERVVEKFQAYIERFLEIIINAVKVDINIPQKHQSTHPTYLNRRKVSLSVSKLASVIKLDGFYEYLYELVVTSRANKSNIAESALYIIHDIIYYIPYKTAIEPSENTSLKLVAYICTKSSELKATARYFGISLIGDLLCKFDQEVGIMEDIMKFLISALEEKSYIAEAAAISLGKIFNEQWIKAVTRYDLLIEIGYNMERYNITKETNLLLLRGMSEVLDHLTDATFQNVMKQLLILQLNPLLSLLLKKMERNQLNFNLNNLQKPLTWIQRATALLRNITPMHKVNEKHPTVHPIVSILNEFWPILLEIMETFTDYKIALNEINKFICSLIRIAGCDSVHLIDQLIRRVILYYQYHTQSSFLIISKMLIEVFIDSADYKKIVAMMDKLSVITMTIISQHPQRLYILLDFFALCFTFLNMSPLLYFRSDFHEIVMRLTLYGCISMRDVVVEASLKLLSAKLNWGLERHRGSLRCRSLVRSFARKHSSDIVLAILLIYLERGKRSQPLPFAAKVIISLKSILFKDEFTSSFHIAIDLLVANGPQYHALDLDRNHLINAVLFTNNVSKMLSVLQNLSYYSKISISY